ncbi:hypothetical protein ADICEAN_02835 [Cesiribacter andamanensis AMV16]|uniref:Uncharacterized protein n=1 Tax=Cesiribacter andamanensis AMV16 TaxID=1279009 RepID=M7N031_9BACT|nr:hypothetical protein ADICEAN_02835 [Cesiribacter andamanensis AMV16]
MGILHKKVSGIQQQPALLFGHNRKGPEHRLGKGLLNRLPLGRIFAQGSVAVVGLNEQYLRAPALKFYNAGVAQLAPVQPNVVGAYACRQGVYIDDLLARTIQAQIDLVRLLLIIEGNKPLLQLHLSCFGSYSRRIGGCSLGSGRLGRAAAQQ